MNKKMTQKEFNRLMNTPIEELGFTARTFNCLKRVRKDNVLDLVRMTKKDLEGVRNFSAKCVDEVISKLYLFDLDIRPFTISEYEWIEELEEKLITREAKAQGQKINDEKNSMRIIAKLLEVWNDDIEKEVQDIIDRNI